MEIPSLTLTDSQVELINDLCDRFEHMNSDFESRNERIKVTSNVIREFIKEHYEISSEQLGNAGNFSDIRESYDYLKIFLSCLVHYLERVILRESSSQPVASHALPTYSDLQYIGRHSISYEIDGYLGEYLGNSLCGFWNFCENEDGDYLFPQVENGLVFSDAEIETYGLQIV